MCTTCGCGQGQVKIEGEHEHEHRHADGTEHTHPHAHEGEHAHEHAHQHWHQHEDGSWHSHTHEHDSGHVHGHEHAHPHHHADGTVHVHGHDHGGEHAHAHDHEHPHVHADGLAHSHPHGHEGDHAHSHAPGAHPHADGTWHSHEGPGEHVHEGDGALHYGLGPAHAHAPGMSQARMVKIEQDILAKNDQIAAGNRQRLADRGVFALNLVSSPGSGKTTLLAASIRALMPAQPVVVIEGDQQTTNDAERIRAAGAPAIQVNTGKGCHLDAAMVERALERLPLPSGGVLFIENVGNLVCPAAFDLGEACKVAVLSVTEGEDKPLKYPDMFRAARLMLLNKVDLLPYLSFDVERCIAYARQVNPEIEVMQVSATTGQGMDPWLAWVRAGVRRAREAQLSTVEGLRLRVAELEDRLAPRH